jgi:phospholipid/cholesterol/gamma-HCH transport system substrate-binding protein
VAKRSVAEVATGVVVLAVTAGFLAYALANTGRSSATGLPLTARFDNVGSLATGADVRLSGVNVGRVVSTDIDPKSFQAVVHLTVQPDLKLPTDSSAVISTGGLLGAPFVTLAPGGADDVLKENGVITITQSATNLEDLLGKFIFNVGSLADATQKSLKQTGHDPAAETGKP